MLGINNKYVFNGVELKSTKNQSNELFWLYFRDIKVAGLSLILLAIVLFILTNIFRFSFKVFMQSHFVAIAVFCILLYFIFAIMRYRSIFYTSAYKKLSLLQSKPCLENFEEINSRLSDLIFDVEFLKLATLKYTNIIYNIFNYDNFYKYNYDRFYNPTNYINHELYAFNLFMDKLKIQDDVLRDNIDFMLHIIKIDSNAVSFASQKIKDIVGKNDPEIALNAYIENEKLGKKILDKFDEVEDVKPKRKNKI